VRRIDVHNVTLLWGTDEPEIEAAGRVYNVFRVDWDSSHPLTAVVHGVEKGRSLISRKRLRVLVTALPPEIREECHA
jgi:hypothetical protein